jgi:VanZ family protein
MSIRSMLKIGSAGVLALLLLFAALGPAKLQLRTGLGWQIDHVAGYFVLTLLLYAAWPRPLIVAGSFMAVATLLEGLQYFTPDRTPDVQAALYSVGGVLSAALLVEFSIRARNRLARQSGMSGNNAGVPKPVA